MSVALAASMAPSPAFADDLTAAGAVGAPVAPQAANPVLKDGKAQSLSFKGSIRSFDCTIEIASNSLVNITNTFNKNADSVMAMLSDANGESLGIWYPLRDKKVGQFALRPGTYNLNYLVGSASSSLTTSGTVAYTTAESIYDPKSLKASTFEKFFPSAQMGEYSGVDNSKIATPVSFGKPFIGTNCMPPTDTDLDYYAFTVKEQGPYRVQLKQPDAEAKLVWLCNAKGDTLKNSKTKRLDIATTKDTHVADIDLGTLKKGKYYIAVGPQSTASYTSAAPYCGFVMKDIVKCKVKGIKNKKYTGKKVTQSITVTWNGKALKKGRDYGVAYSNNKNVGKATISIYGKGEFRGNELGLTKTFRITK